MKIIEKAFLVVLSTVLFQACNTSSDHPDKVKTVDSLLSALSEAEKQLRTLDTTSIIARTNSLDSTLNTLMENKPDTIDRETGILAERLMTQKRPFDTFRNKKTLFLKQVEYTKEQLSNLSHDLNKNLVPAEKIEEYFATEKRKASDLIETALHTAEGMNKSLVDFDSIHVPIQQMVLKLKAKKDSIASSVK